MQSDALYPAKWAKLSLVWPFQRILFLILKFDILRLFQTYILVSSTKTFHLGGIVWQGVSVCDPSEGFLGSE